MIVRPIENGTRLIAQHDHARAAGTIARKWDRDGIIPEPPNVLKDAVFFAIDNHDVGWCPKDESPFLDTRTLLPQSFYGMSAGEATEIWSESIVFCAAYQPLAGYMVSSHFSALAQAGVRGAPMDDLKNLKDFVREEGRRREILLSQLSSSEKDACESATLLLRTCDTLSLFACRAPEVIPPEGQIHQLPRVGLKIRLQDSDVMELAPWPFEVDRLEIRFPGSTIPGSRFESSEDLEEALEMAEPGLFAAEILPLG